MTVDYRVELGDVRQVPADLLVLKYAQASYGADELVSAILVARGVCSEESLKPRAGKGRDGRHAGRDRGEEARARAVWDRLIE